MIGIQYVFYRGLSSLGNKIRVQLLFLSHQNVGVATGK